HQGNDWSFELVQMVHIVNTVSTHHIALLLRIPLHLQQGKALFLNFCRITKLEHSLHDLVLRDLLPIVILQEGSEGSRATTDIIGLPDDVLKAQGNKALHRDVEQITPRDWDRGCLHRCHPHCQERYASQAPAPHRTVSTWTESPRTLLMVFRSPED